MLYYIEEYQKYVEITGFCGISFGRADTILKATRSQQRQVEIQFFDADLIASPEHLYFSVVNALLAFRGKTNISKSLAVETMLYAAAQRQIKKAIDRIGIKPQSQNMAVTVIGDDPKQIQRALEELAGCLGLVPDESVLALTAEKQQKIRGVFQIGDEEIAAAMRGSVEEAVVALVVERVALLSTQT